ncbi:MAG: hypothetical protein ACTHLO_01010 [Pseudolabrys sp.]
MSISSIGIQTVTPSTGTPQERPQQQQQQSAANDNSSQSAAKSGSSSSQTTGRHVDKLA